MKMTLKICGSPDQIRLAMKALSDEKWESNCCGDIEGASFDYDFVDADNLFSDDSGLDVVNPNEV